MKKSRDNNESQIAHVVSHTHWDREWRWPIWQTRMMLVDFLDELIEVLESGQYAGFLLDGQVIPVLDYLDTRPEMKERIIQLVQADKLQIGPWYTLPDQYPVDGEALVRNLLWGMRKADELGGAFRVGYTSFGWGQTAQLPQIYAGFGIDLAFVGKQVSKKRAPHSEFVWRSPDGSELLATRFGSDGRANFYFNVHLSLLFGIDHKGSDWYYDWANGGIAYHRADAEQMEQDHFRLDPPTDWHPEFVTPELIEAVWRTTDDSVLDNDRLMMNGCDYTAAQPLLQKMLDRFNEVDAQKNRKWVQSTLPQFIDLMRRDIDQSSLCVVEGELRDGPAGPLTGNALSTRLYVKRLNKHAQNMLIRFAEPTAAMATVAGSKYPHEFLRQAWQYLLESHPHDSINAVAQDKTALDVCDRLRQVIDISQAVGNRAMQELIRRIDTSSYSKTDVLVVVFNPLPYKRREVIEAWVNVPDSTARNQTWRAYQDPQGLMVFDADDNPLGTQNEGATQETYCISELHTRAFPFNCLRHRIFFDTGDVPACGYKVFRVSPMADDRPAAIPWSDSVAGTGSLLTSPNRLENEHLVVQMNPNGTFDLTSKETGKKFQGLNYYEDRGEHGDYWFNRRPMFDDIHTSLGCSARIWSQESGPLHATLVSEITMLLPRKGDLDQQRRGAEKAELTIRTAVTLKSGHKYAQVNVEFDNHHHDHYLRAMFPSGLVDAEYADAGGHFTVDRRPIQPQGPTENSIWPDMATQPMNMFLDVSDSETGLAFLTDSLTEYEVLDNEERTVALSLLRAVRNWICTETRVGSSFPSQTGGQCLGRHNIRYAMFPHSGGWHEANVPLTAECFSMPARPVQTNAHAGTLADMNASMLEISNPLLRFSAIKKTEDRPTWLVRFYNPTAQVQKGHLTFSSELTHTWSTNLDEQRQAELPLTDANTVSISVDAHKIVTVEVELNQR